MSRVSTRFLPAYAIALLFATAACSNSTGPSSSGTTTLVAVVAGAAENGTLRLTVDTVIAGRLVSLAPGRLQFRPAAAATGVVNVTGTLKLVGGTPISVSGTYNAATGAISVSGGGYTFTGTFAKGVLSGTFSGPNGSGSFSGQASSGTNPTTQYCGTFVASGGHHGVFSLVIAGANAEASSYDVNNGLALSLSGTVSGSSFTVFGSQGTFTLTATGTISGSSVSGSFSSNGGQGGTFSGSVCS